MSACYIFVPRAELSAKKNLQEFIHRCRTDITVFGPELPFNEDVWDISATISTPGRTKAVRVIFSSYEASKSGQPRPTMSAEFLPFAKAYFRYRFGHCPSKAWANRLAALRAVDCVLRRRSLGGSVISLTHAHFDEVRSLILEGFSQSVAAKVVGEVEALSDFLIENGFVQARTRWLRNLARPRDELGRVGAKADKARKEKMPSVAAIQAMAHVFHNATDQTDMYIGSALALLHCAPQRINETVRLKFDCLRESVDSDQCAQLGLCFSGSKGFPDSVRWILPTMANVARKALQNLIEVSTHAREVARWYEKNPGQLYLPKGWEHLRCAHVLSPEDVSIVLYGNANPKKAIRWCKAEGIISDTNVYAFKDIEAAIVAKLPKSFPYAQDGLLFSEALFIARRFELDASLTPYACLVDYISSDQIAARIGANGSVKRTVFDKFNLTEDDGSPIHVESHQVRHYLNTLAQSNGLSQIDIALWSGRTDIRQNGAYDHLSASALVVKARDTVRASILGIFGGDPKDTQVRVVVRRDEATGNLRHLTAHTTDFGLCTHDYGASPCPIHRDCLNCNELVCVKGDTFKLANLVQLRNETEILLRKAEAAEEGAVYGASRWVEHQRRTLDHCNELISILSDESIPAGAVVKLTGIKPASRIEQAAAQRAEKPVAVHRRVNKLLEKVNRG